MYNALNDSGRDEVGDLPTPLPKPAPRLSRVSTMGREMLASLNRVMAQYPPTVAQELGLPTSPGPGASAPPKPSTPRRGTLLRIAEATEGARRRWNVAAATVVQRNWRRKLIVLLVGAIAFNLLLTTTAVTVSHHRTNVQMKEARRNLREDLGKTKAWVAGNRNTIVKVLAVEAVIVGANVWVGYRGWKVANLWSKFKVGDRIKETVKTIKVVNRFTKPFRVPVRLVRAPFRAVRRRRLRRRGLLEGVAEMDRVLTDAAADAGATLAAGPPTRKRALVSAAVAATAATTAPGRTALSLASRTARALYTAPFAVVAAVARAPVALAGRAVRLSLRLTAWTIRVLWY